jgi:ParB/RepB/Spo0J family partition protein
MELEFHQLELRYEGLRMLRPVRERQLLSSLANSGQQVPVVVVADSLPQRFVLIDGYKRVRCLKRLVRDTVKAAALELAEVEALVLSRQMARAESETALEQAWLLDEIERRFGLSQEELARRFDRSVSWVSRRLALVRELPVVVQERVRGGELAAHGAVKYLVPLARANKTDCEGLVAAIATARLSSRDLGALYGAWRDGTAKTRQRVIEAPLVVLKAIKQMKVERAELGPGPKLLNDCELLGAVARRAHRQVREGVVGRLLPGEREEIGRALEQARSEVRRLGDRWDQEVKSAGSGPTQGDPRVEPPGPGHSEHRPGDEAVAQGGEDGAPCGVGGGAEVGAAGEGRATP